MHTHARACVRACVCVCVLDNLLGRVCTGYPKGHNESRGLCAVYVVLTSFCRSWSWLVEDEVIVKNDGWF